MRELGEWIYWGVTESLKYILVVGGILGFSIRPGWKKYLAVLYLVVMIPSVIMLGIENPVEFTTIWGVVLLICFFKEKISNIIKAFFLSYLMISIGDMFIWGILINLFPSLLNINWSENLSDSIGLMFFLILMIFLSRKKEKTYELFLNLSFGWFIILFLMLLGFGLVVAGVKGGLEMSLPAHFRRFLYLVLMFTLIFLIIICVSFTNTVISKRKLEEINKIEKNYLQLQQKYYESRLQQNEEIIKFRHDINKHMKVIKLLCENNETKELKSYIEDVLESYPDYGIVYTDNFIADFFIGELLKALQDKEDFSYSITGRFPEKIPVSNAELSILVANVLENAKNALLQVEGKSKLVIQVGHYKEHMIIDIQNSRSPVKVDDIKEREGYHGYGLKNIQTVVDKYEGSMEIQEKPELFAIKIVI